MRIALAEDDGTMRDFVANLVREGGHSCTTCRNGREMMTTVQRDTFDLLIIDWNMPGMTGLELVQWARVNLKPCPPIMMLTSRAEKDDIVIGLNAGADDYIIKPEEPHVIRARIDALLRRIAPPEPTSRIEQFGPYAFDRMEAVVTLGEEKIDLTAREFALARTFFLNPHRALSRAYLLETLWNSVADLPTRTLDMHISRIRSKLRLGPENGYRLQTIFGYGYRLERFDAGE